MIGDAARRRPIRRIGGCDEFPSDLRAGVVAIGNFDGVHRGHQRVLGEAASVAATSGRPLVCLTFEPHPRSLFRPDRPVRRLTPAPMKARLLDHIGFDAVVEQTFDRDFAAQEPADFVRDVLIDGLGVSHVVAGFDFHYGARRGGTPETLKAAGDECGFGVTLVSPLTDGEGAIISSSRVRGHLETGDVAIAAELLGYRWTVRGEVVHGRKVGRTLGYPTANLRLADDALLRHGIYAVRLRRADGTLHDGVASYGRRPTFDDGAALFETFVFDFSGDLYGETVDVSLFGFLRGEEKFADVEALITQMDLDQARARVVLGEAEPLSPLDKAIAF